MCLQADGVGLAGAIIKMARDGRVAEQPVAHGVIVYYIVDSLEMVTSSTCVIKTHADSSRWRKG
jgi:hypothetical protein